MNSTFKHRKLYLPKTDYSDMEDEEMYGRPYSPVDKRILAICPRIKDGFICNSPSFKHWKLIDDDRREIFHNQSNRVTTEAITSIKYDPNPNDIAHLNSAIDTQNIFSSVDKTNSLPSECFEPNNTKQIKPKVEETKELKKSKRGRRSQQRCRPSSKKASHIQKNDLLQISNESNVSFRRWGREQDCELYEIVLVLQSQDICSLHELLSLERPFPRRFKKILGDILKQTQWKGPKYLLFKRILRLFKYSTFSVREKILLKRIMKKRFHYKDLDYKKIALSFPGKPIETVTEVCNQILKEKGLI